MEHRLTSEQETACYINILKNLLARNVKDVSGEKVFFMINGYRIMCNGWIGYDYKKELSNLTFIRKVDNDYNSLASYINQKDLYGIITFINTNALTYNEIYKNNKGKTHCIRIISATVDTVTIEDTHIRINDMLMRSQIAEMSWKQLLNARAETFIVDLNKMNKEYDACGKARYKKQLEEFFNADGCGISSIEEYIKEKITLIDFIPPDELVQTIQDTYYDLKISSYLYVNKYIETTYCNFCGVSLNDFELNYIISAERIMEKLFYHSLKGNYENIKYCLKELLEICKKERNEFNYECGRRD